MGFGAERAAVFDASSRQQQRQQFMGMNAFDRHKKMVHDLITYYGGKLPQAGQTAPQKSDFDILVENFRFIRSEEDDATDSWEVRLARRYYSKLFREYAVADLSRYKEGKVGLRWRTQREVVNGAGQFECGAKGCGERRGLASFEVPFSYVEAGERKQALVKVRVCPTHAYQLNYRKQQEAEERHKAQRRKAEEKERRRKERRRGRSKAKGRGREKDRDRRKGGKKRSRHGSSSDGASSDDSGDSTSSSSQPEGSEEEGEGEEQRGGSASGQKRRRHSHPTPRDGQPAAQPAAAAAAAAAGSSEPAAEDFEAFLKGLFE
ncbi:hypothetical protein ACK3TF_004070 [Chlorella vulgaris]